ncbi:MAG: hypothetical protein ACRDLN_13120 [Solirubrobacteraceae bacterium]
MTRGDGSGGDGMGRVRALFVLYLLIVAGGIAFYVVIGLTHH